MWSYESSTWEDFSRGQAVTLMANGEPIGSKMIVVGAYPADSDMPELVACAWHDNAKPHREHYPPSALCLLSELESYRQKENLALINHTADPPDEKEQLQGISVPGSRGSKKEKEEQLDQWLIFYELLLPKHGAAKAADEADEAMAQLLARKNAPAEEKDPTLYLPPEARTLIDAAIAWKDFMLRTEHPMGLPQPLRELYTAVLAVEAAGKGCQPQPTGPKEKDAATLALIEAALAWEKKRHKRPSVAGTNQHLWDAVVSFKEEDSSSYAALHLSTAALAALKNYRLLLADFPEPCTTDDARALDDTERKLLDALAEPKD